MCTQTHTEGLLCSSVLIHYELLSFISLSELFSVWVFLVSFEAHSEFTEKSGLIMCLCGSYMCLCKSVCRAAVIWDDLLVSVSLWVSMCPPAYCTANILKCTSINKLYNHAHCCCHLCVSSSV